MFLVAAGRSVAVFAGERDGVFKSYELKSDGYPRTYGVYAPAGLKLSKKYPLLVVLHGGGGSGRQMRRMTRNGFESLADRNGAIVAYPDALDKHWDDYRGIRRAHANDVAFIAAMLDRLTRTYPVDASRIYATGVSNGAMMSYALACLAADKFAAVAPVAGSMPRNLLPSCRPSRSVPILIINGTEDRLVHWEGGAVTGPFGVRKFGETIAVAASRDFWLKNNACDASKKESSTKNSDPRDGTVLVKEIYASCAGGGTVEFLKIEGGGHTWPGGMQSYRKQLVGATSTELSANDEIWDFFMAHRNH